MPDKDKPVDKSSEDFNDGYKFGYQDNSFTEEGVNKLGDDLGTNSEDHKAGRAEGERDRFRDDQKK